MKAYPSVETLREWFDYDPATGVIYWKKKQSRAPYRVGDMAGNLNSLGYYQIRLRGQLMMLHRIAYALHHGHHPPHHVDHINGVTYDNRIHNLRAATNTENGFNARRSKSNTSGVKGVCWHKGSNKWMARMVASGEEVYLGVFETIEEAAEARRAAAEKYHGEFVNHG